MKSWISIEVAMEMTASSEVKRKERKLTEGRIMISIYQYLGRHEVSGGWRKGE